MAASGSAQLVIDTAIRHRNSHNSGKSLAIRIVVALVVLAFGLFLATTGSTSDDSAPVCDGQTMQQGDTCMITGSGGGSFSYDEMIERDNDNTGTQHIIGWVIVALAVAAGVPAAVAANPQRPWGKPVPQSCPSCRQTNVREKLTSHSTTANRRRYTTTGIVSLCTTPGCAFATIRRP